jgi:hypothetical protein
MNDPFATDETRARGTWYEVIGYPTVFTDGGGRHEGASSCSGAMTTYREEIERRLAETAGLSPVSITGTVSFDADSVRVSVTYELVDAIHMDDLRATVLLFEDGVHGPSDPFGHTIYNGVTRRIHDEAISLENQNDAVTLNVAISVESGWVIENLRCVAYLQRTATKEIVQGRMLPAVDDYSMAFDHRLRSSLDVNGIGLFRARLENILSEDQTMVLEPGTPFGDWTVDYLVGDDPVPHTGVSEITLDPAGTCDLVVRVHTGPVQEIRTGSFLVTSRTTGRLQETILRLYNGSPSILLVDDDGTASSEVPVISALVANGFIFESRNVHDDGDPLPQDLAGYDAVIWETGRWSGELLSDMAAERLMTYLDSDGALFLTSTYFLNRTPVEGTRFTRDYLGVASFALDRGYRSLIGMPADPIGGGMLLPLHFDWPTFYRGDDATPGASARTVFLANDGSHAMIRNETARGGKVVFLAEALDGISEDDPDPNNTKILVGRIVDWLLAPVTADAQDVLSQPGSWICDMRPNPFRATTQIEYVVSTKAAAGIVRFEVFDLTGRRVARLVDESQPPGRHTVDWNGHAGDGGEIASGLYLTRLMTLDGSVTRKVMLLR